MNLALVIFAALLAAGPAVIGAGDLETAYQHLKDAEASKDAVQVKKTAVEACTLAREAIASPMPEGADAQAAWKKHVDFAHEVELQSEYALYATALQAPPATAVDLLSTLVQQNPKSKYLNDGYALYFSALEKTHQASKIPEVAEKALANFPDNDDALVLLANTAMNRKQNDRALGYAKRLIVVLNKHGRPEGMTAAAWEHKRDAALGSGYWIAGVIEAEKAHYYDADKNLRAALPLIAGNNALKGPALFYLGMANYNLGKMTMKKSLVLEGARFSRESAAIPGPMAQQAWHNAMVMKDEAARMR
jgi:tetratricopeptide (TPR) repeat protein